MCSVWWRGVPYGQKQDEPCSGTDQHCRPREVLLPREGSPGVVAKKASASRARATDVVALTRCMLMSPLRLRASCVGVPSARLCRGRCAWPAVMRHARCRVGDRSDSRLPRTLVESSACHCGGRPRSVSLSSTPMAFPSGVRDRRTRGRRASRAGSEGARAVSTRGSGRSRPTSTTAAAPAPASVPLRTHVDAGSLWLGGPPAC